MSQAKYALLGLMLLVIAGCGKSTPEEVEDQPPAAAQEPAPQTEPVQAVQEEPQVVTPAQPKRASAPPKQTPPVISKPASEPAPEPVKAEPQPKVVETVPPVSQALEEPPAPKAPEPRYLTIPNGTTLQVRLQDPLDTAINQTGDLFQAILDQDIVMDGTVVAPRGSLLEGKLSNVARSGRVEGRAAMSLQLYTLKIGDQSYPLQTAILSFEAESTKKKDAAKVGIGAGIGALVGAIAGGGKGAAIGAAVGGGAGGATVLATRGEEVKFEPEDIISFTLSRDVTVKLK